MGYEQSGLNMTGQAEPGAEPWRRTDGRGPGPHKLVYIPRVEGRAPSADTLSQAGITLDEQVVDIATLADNSPLLTDVDATLSSGLIDEWGLPLLVAIDDSLASSLQNTALSEPWMATVQRAIEDTGLLYLFDQARQLPTLAVIHTELVNELFDQVNIQPFLQTIKYDLQSYLFNPMLNSSWLESLNNTTSTGLFDSMGNPWFQTLHFSLDDYLYDWTNSRPWLDTISTQLTSLLAIIEDVYDSTQHALRTV